jgi:hypothetical protein
LHADYGKPRTKGGYLPNPRLISKIVHTATVPQEDDPERSLFCMQFGQLLAHDMVLTEQFISKLLTLLCGIINLQDAAWCCHCLFICFSVLDLSITAGSEKTR